MTRRRRRFVPDYGAGKFTFSSRFRRVLKKYPVPRYRVGIAAGWAVPTLYKALAGMTPISKDDPKVLKLCEIIGMSPDLALVDFMDWGR